MMLVCRIVEHACVVVYTQRRWLLARKSYRCVLTQKSDADEYSRLLSNSETLYNPWRSRELIIDSEGSAGQTTRNSNHMETTKCDFAAEALFIKLEAFGSLTLVKIGCYIIDPDVKDAKDQSPA